MRKRIIFVSDAPATSLLLTTHLIATHFSNLQNWPIIYGFYITLHDIRSIQPAPRYRAEIEFMQLSKMSMATLATIHLVHIHRLGQQPKFRGGIDSQSTPL